MKLPLLYSTVTLSSASWAFAQGALPQPLSNFRGEIERIAADSVPDWPRGPSAPRGAPNIVLILLDDVGFGAASTFGGPAATPELDRLAGEGLRYNRFHVCGLCSPSRAALLTGRNHHRVGFGTIADTVSGYPGYDGVLRKKDVLLPEVLRRNGYSTAAFGKWHNTPRWEISPAGPFDRWPTGLGFEYFYGFLLGAASQYEPPLYRDTTPVEPPQTPGNGYHFTTDIVDEAIQWLRLHEDTAPGKPYFLYLATGATHQPLHVPREWVARYKGKFDQGWDRLREETFARQKQLGVIPANAELTSRPKELAAWDSLGADQRRLGARQMEVYAAFLSHTDHEVGRLLDIVRNRPDADNTLILYIVGDNGASGEGGLEGTYDNSVIPIGAPAVSLDEYLGHIDELGGVSMYNHYPSAWAWACDTPFQWCKQVASHLGAIRDPMIVSWPARIKDKGALRDQFTHLIDIAPTIYEAVGIPFPAEVDGVRQDPLDGSSFAATFDSAKAPSSHTVQYFEMVGNRSIYKDGWLASARHTVPWVLTGLTDDYDAERWELYNLNEDFSQARDLAAKYPDKLAKMKALFDREAQANSVYPLASANTDTRYPFDGRPSFQQCLRPDSHSVQGRPNPLKGKTEFVYYPGMPRIPIMAMPDLSRSHRITAQMVIPEGGAEGVIIAYGSRLSGFTLYIKNDRLVYENNFFNRHRDTIMSSAPIPRGKVEAVFEYARESPAPWGGGSGRLYINGQLVGEGRIAHFWPWEAMSVGRQFGSPVSPNYEVPFRFTGSLKKVSIQLL